MVTKNKKTADQDVKNYDLIFVGFSIVKTNKRKILPKMQKNNPIIGESETSIDTIEKTVRQFLKKIKMKLLHDLIILIPYIYSKELR